MQHNIIWAFSGSSHSGKTTLIRKITEKFPEQTRTFAEIIRKRPEVTSIDELRKDADAYFQVQLEIIQQKIDHEAEARVVVDQPKLILIDRTLADSIFYYMTYVRPEKLNSSRAWQYSGFYHHVIKSCQTRRYDQIFFMDPLPVKEVDSMRPQNLDSFQLVEANMIGTLCDLLFPHVPKVRIHAQRDVELVLEMAHEAIRSLVQPPT